MTSTPGLDALSALSGIPRNDLLRDHRLLGRALAESGRSLVETGLALGAEDDDVRRAAELRREQLTELLDAGRSEPGQARRRLADLLTSLADQLRAQDS